MPNVLDNLANDIYVAADRVGRELVGAIPAATMNAETSSAAVGQKVTSHFTREATVNDISPSMTIPEGDNQTIDTKDLEMTKQRGSQIPWTGEEIKLVRTGAGFETIYGDQIQQAMRKIANEAEADLCADIYKNASRSVGTPGTTPFGSDFDLVAEARQVLVDNGCAMDGDANMVVNTLAGTKLRNLADLRQVDKAGSDDPLRNGTLLDLQGLGLKESAGIQQHTAGTGAATYRLNGAASKGDTTIDIDTGSGTILAGDVVTIGSHNYVVRVALTGGSVILNNPGLVEDLADNAVVTVAASRTGNFAFHRTAAEIAFRTPANPDGGDAAVDTMEVQDPYSGLVFLISAYKGYHKAMFEVAAVWGTKTWKSDNVVGIAG